MWLAAVCSNQVWATLYTIFSAIKRKFGHRLGSIRKDLQRKELMTKVLAYNLNILYRIN
jgi:hypothetical protein